MSLYFIKVHFTFKNKNTHADITSNLNDILSIRSAYMTIKIIKDSSKLESSMNKINKL